MPLVRTSAPSALVRDVDCVLPATTEQEQAFSTRYQMLFPRLLDYARRFLSREAAEDAVQEAMTDTWIRKPLIAMEGPSIAYFFGAVKNQIRLQRRRDYRERIVLGDYLYEWAHRTARRSAPDVALEEAELAGIIEANVALMPERCRSAWALVRENEFPYAQAAEWLEITVSGTKQLITRAQAMLREALVAAGFRLSTCIFPRRASTASKMLPQMSARRTLHT
jgi:RNA polymerase sigma factor (sigma-70 family)